MHAIGIDIGGTKIAGALVDESGNILRELRVPTPAEDPRALTQAVADLINKLAEGEQVLGAGIAAAGFIDAEQANIVYAPNLSWRNEPFKANVEALVDIPVILENDANAAGWAEYRFGAGKGYKHMVMLTIGTGVGGAVITDSHMLRGGFGIAGELGHLRVVPDGRLCGCGQHGCLESYGSGSALLRSAKELAASGDPLGKRLRELEIEKGQLTGVEVYAAIVENDPGALQILRELGGWIGQAIASLVAVLDPEIVVIGGGVSAAGDLLLDPIREAFLKHLPARGFRPELKIAVAEFVNDAGVVGAADLVRDSKR
ncbi:MAG: ROK family glucokinase [Actinomycetales bacterium]|nr:ROK family glucokinase [Actinomycetales bacterium]